MPEFPLTSVEKMFKNHGAQRVSHDAKEELSNLLESIGLEVANAAAYLASKEKRKTVTAKDIKKANNELWG